MEKSHPQKKGNKTWIREIREEKGETVATEREGGDVI